MTKRTKLVKKLDDLTRKIVFLREPNLCVVDGRVNNLQLGHIFSRRHYSTRWDIEPNGNCHIQCAGCNISHNGNAWPYFNWYIEKFGAKVFRELESRHRELFPIKDFQLQIMIDSYKSILKTLESKV